VKPVRRLDEAVAPDGSVLALLEHDGDYVIRVNGVDLMSTRRHHSEDQLAERACASLGARPGMQVLIGGLGLGFTLKAALRVLAPDAVVVVAELVDQVIAWNRNADYPFASDALRDARVELVHGDVAQVMRDRPGAFDAIMLDVDNGADPLTTAGNAALYRYEGILTAVAALRPGGRLAYWSADADRAFERAMRRARLTVQSTLVGARATARPQHVVYVGLAPKGKP
jgi:spermidine synthase